MPEDYPGYADVEDFDIDAPENAGRMTIRKAVENARILSDGRGEKPKAGTSAAKASRAAAKPAKRARKASAAEPAEASAADASRASANAAAEPDGQAESEGEASEGAEDADGQPEPGNDGAAPPDRAFVVKEINRDHAIILIGSKVFVIKENSVGPIEDRHRILTVEAFRTWHGNRFIKIRTDDTIKTITWATAWLQSPQRRAYSGIEFFPDPNNAPGTPGYYNLWRGFAFAPKPKPNGYKTFRDHLLNNVCGGDEALFAWVFAFFADMVQRPRERSGVALVLRGKMGSGKTVVGHHFGALFASHYFLVDDPRYVTGQFNAHMAGALMVQADEAVWAGNKAAEGRLKGLVTSLVQMIEAKGIDPIRVMNYLRLLMTSNENWVVPAGKDERRFAVLDVDPRCAGNHGYFREMEDELLDGGYEALLYDLLAFDLSKVNLRTIPKTKALLKQKEKSLDHVDAWWLSRLKEGCSTKDADFWETLVARQALFDDYIKASEKTGINRRAAEIDFHETLTELVPDLKYGGRHLTRVRDEHGKLMEKRCRCYRVPPLQDCRSAWDAAMQQPTEWPDDDDPQGAGEK